jgi:hypothetical protein
MRSPSDSDAAAAALRNSAIVLAVIQNLYLLLKKHASSDTQTSLIMPLRTGESGVSCFCAFEDN